MELGDINYGEDRTYSTELNEKRPLQFLKNGGQYDG